MWRYIYIKSMGRHTWSQTDISTRSNLSCQWMRKDRSRNKSDGRKWSESEVPGFKFSTVAHSRCLLSQQTCVLSVQKHVCLWSKRRKSARVVKLRLKLSSKFSRQLALYPCVNELRHIITPLLATNKRSRSEPHCPNNIPEIVNNPVRLKCQDKDKISREF